MSKPASRFVIVSQPTQPRPWLRRMLLAFAWLMTLVAIGAWASWRAAPALGDTGAELLRTRAQLHAYLAELRDLRQREATLARADQINRTANREVQQALIERDAEIASLRADVAFYERLVGATAPKKELNVHSAKFEPEAGGTWRYGIVLTQTLNRGAISAGELHFAVEGVLDGKLAMVGWDQLHQRAQAPAQTYSFKYFQQLDGSVMLPPGFTPQRVRVSLRGSGAPVEQTLGWQLATETGET